MTSKLGRTIIGVGIALGAAPGCLGRTGPGNDFGSSREAEGDGTPDPAPTSSPGADAEPPDSGRDAPGTPPDATVPPDAAVPPDATVPPDAAVPPDASTADAGLDADAPDAAMDASVDPFCDVAWPPTKGNPTPGRVACVDPLHECTGAYVPRNCYRLIEPYTCSGAFAFEGPLYCYDGQWRCPPGSDFGPRCKCWGPLPSGVNCTDAGTLEDAGAGGAGGE